MSSAVDDYTYLRNFHYSVQSDKVQETQWLWQQDSNGGTYESGKLTFDLSQFANNGIKSYQDWARAHLVIPLVATINADAVGINRCDFGVTLKPSFVNVINSAVLEVNNKVLMNSNNYSNIPAYFTQLTSCSLDDQNARSYLGLDDLDTPNSWSYNNASPSPNTGLSKTFNGNGLCNTLGSTPNVVSAYTWGNNLNVGEISNNGFFERCKKVRSLQSNLGIALIEDETTLRDQLKNYTRAVAVTTTGSDSAVAGTVATSHQVWYFTAIIKLSDICGGYFDKLGLIKGAHYVKLTLDVNCVGSMILEYAQNVTDGTMQTVFKGESSFNWTCPLAVNPSGLGIPTAATSRKLCLSVGIVKPPVLLSSYTGTQHNTLGLQHAMGNCRIYVPTVKLENNAEQALIGQGVSKKILFDDYFQTSNTIQSKSSMNMVVSNSIRGAYAMLVCAYPSRSIHGLVTGLNTRPFSVLQSPFAPVVAPMPLTQLQVNVNGQNLFTQGQQSYSWEQYVEQIKGFRSVNGNEEIGLASSIMSKDDWENGNRFYLFTFNDINIDGSANINFSCYNPSNIASDLLVFVFTKKQVVVNTQSGQFESTNF